MRAFLFSVTSALAIVATSNVASADDPPDAARAAALFAEGRQLMAAQDYASACPDLAESQSLDPSPDTARDLGICYQKASELAFKAARELARVPEQGVAPTSVHLRVPEPGAEQSPPGQTQRLVGLTIGGAGVAGVVVGAITGVMAKSANDRLAAMCPNTECPPGPAVQELHSANNLATATTISFIASAAALGTGAIVFFTAPRSKAGIGVGPAVEGTGMSIAGRF